ncbi:ABC transporter permease [Sulfitobacter sp. S190]|uniref:ABC transporter permease n=1 Tax=Sulfitobacter sp. S190 TaxID=2867022 RepID=UPI0021A3C104|nr:ABC transporter permease [Sulfitobacter sp. S190]UWR23856.1 ABC transporter permease [Sulfitobacter sp. S190]
MAAAQFRYILGRLLWSALAVSAVATLSFFISRAVPGGPFNSVFLDSTRIENARRAVGADRPLTQQFASWLSSALRGDFGESYVYSGQTVVSIVANALPLTLMIAIPTLVIAVIGALLSASFVATRLERTRRRALVLAATASSVPVFVTAPLLSLVFGVWLQVLPVSGTADSAARGLILPVIALALPLTAALYMLCAPALQDALRHESVRTARAKGTSRAQTVHRHALCRALIPTLSYAGTLIAGVLLGAAIVETVFNIPGLGRVFIDAAIARDYPVLSAATIITALVVITVNVCVDIAYVLLDPRLERAG